MSEMTNDKENLETNYSDYISSVTSDEDIIDFSREINFIEYPPFTSSPHTSDFGDSVISDKNNGFWKYNEDKTLKEVESYLSSTYHSHYTSEQSKTQTLDLIESIGDAEAFTRSNAIKYLSRFGKKNGKSKMDILKAIHYCVLLYHFAGLHKKNSGNYETF
jgi:hypothetical protein